jgi:hypothetical protein
LKFGKPRLSKAEPGPHITTGEWENCINVLYSCTTACRFFYISTRPLVIINFFALTRFPNQESLSHSHSALPRGYFEFRRKRGFGPPSFLPIRGTFVTAGQSLSTLRHAAPWRVQVKAGINDLHWFNKLMSFRLETFGN